jgi:hypothetical protein
VGFKSRKTRSFLTRSKFRGEALKGCSEGNWRSGRRRSEGGWRRGLGQHFVYSVSCRLSLEHPLCHKNFFWKSAMIRSKALTTLWRIFRERGKPQRR